MLDPLVCFSKAYLTSHPPPSIAAAWNVAQTHIHARTHTHTYTRTDAHARTRGNKRAQNLEIHRYVCMRLVIIFTVFKMPLSVCCVTCAHRPLQEVSIWEPFSFQIPKDWHEFKPDFRLLSQEPWHSYTQGLMLPLSERRSRSKAGKEREKGQQGGTRQGRRLHNLVHSSHLPWSVCIQPHRRCQCQTIALRYDTVW